VTVTHPPGAGCHYFLPGLRLPSQLQSITAHWTVPSYTAFNLVSEAYRCEQLAEGCYAALNMHIFHQNKSVKTQLRISHNVEANTHKSATTHTGNVLVAHDLDLGFDLRPMSHLRFLSCNFVIQLHRTTKLQYAAVHVAHCNFVE